MTKKEAFLVLGITCFIALVITLLLLGMVVLLFPLLITIGVFLLGVAIKKVLFWSVKKYCLSNVKEKVKKVKEKLKIERGVYLLKESYNVVKRK